MSSISTWIKSRAQTNWLRNHMLLLNAWRRISMYSVFPRFILPSIQAFCNFIDVYFSKYEIFATPWFFASEHEVEQLSAMASRHFVWGWPFQHWGYPTAVAMRMWYICLHDNNRPLLYSFQWKILSTNAIVVGRDTWPHFCTCFAQSDIAVEIVTRLGLDGGKMLNSFIFSWPPLRPTQLPVRWVLKA